jgi:hypothetical protein
MKYEGGIKLWSHPFFAVKTSNLTAIYFRLPKKMNNSMRNWLNVSFTKRTQLRNQLTRVFDKFMSERSLKKKELISYPCPNFTQVEDVTEDYVFLFSIYMRDVCTLYGDISTLQVNSPSTSP